MAVTSLVELTLIIFFLFFFSIVSYKKKLLDFEGVLVGNIVGLAAIVFGPHPLINFGTVVVFFVIGEIASNYPKKKHEKRNVWNVVGNSIPAIVSLFLIFLFKDYSFLFELAFFGAVSAALADTLSSEIGYYSKSKPVLITTLKPTKRGVNGGVTLLGEFSALIGGIIIGLIHFFVYNQPIFFVVIAFAGLVGSNMDSLFGALFENKKLLTNTQVNLLGSTCGAIFCILMGLIFM